ncbi:MAG: hypothetical protein EKK41_21160 [Hyphomicrobiales bacterium]|nr:MAG: hypothetical protein EKK41_21160 [Hyphomicrobiales bacterium]
MAEEGNPFDNELRRRQGQHPPGPLPSGYRAITPPGLPPLPPGYEAIDPPTPATANPFARELEARGSTRLASFARPHLANNATPSAPDRKAPHDPDADTRGWGQWAYDSIVGREDPRYKGLPTLDEALTAEGKRQGRFLTSPEQRQIRAAVPFAATDEAYGDVMANALGDRYLGREQDRYGNPIIVYRGDDGHEKRAYVNRPGLDSEDISRGITQAVPYVIGGLGAGAVKAGLLTRSLLQGATAAGVSVGQDLAAQPLGSEQGVSPERAAVAGAAGAAGEAFSVPITAAWRKFVTVPGLFDRASGQLTPKGAQIAIDAGLDPSALTGRIGHEFAKTYARTGEAAAAGRQFASHDLGIESTVGQRTKDAQQLLEEGAMRRGIYGESAKQEMRAFDERQRQQLLNAALGDAENAGAGNLPNSRGLAASMNPARPVESMTPQEFGHSIQEGLRGARASARQAENDAWQGLHSITAHPEAMDLLPHSIGAALGEREIDQVSTPAAYRMATILQRYMTGEAADETLSVLGQNMATPTVDGIRRRLLNTMRNAGTPQDRAAAGRIYDGFNDWIGHAADAQLLLGHPDAAAALRGARQISREIRDLFQPREQGKQTAAANILSKVVEKADSPEAVVQALFGNGPNGGLKIGTIDALDRMRDALQRFGGPEGQNVWNDIRTAYWTKLVTDRKGELASPTVMLNSLKTAFDKQGTVMSRLYQPGELRDIRKLMRALEQITYKDPNPSGSGYAVAAFAKEMLGTIMEAIPFGHKITVPLRAVYSISGVPEMKGRAAARLATGQTTPSAAPTASLAGPSAALAHERNRQRDTQ